MKATAISGANIAFIKYWGQKNTQLSLPYNNSISMTLDNCLTTTTVEFSSKYKKDTVEIAFQGQDYKKLKKSDGDKTAFIFKNIEKIRKLAGIKEYAKIKSKNNFPSDCGIAASSSGFSALIVTLIHATNKTNAVTPAHSITPTHAAIPTHTIIPAKAGIHFPPQNKKELSQLIQTAGSVSAMRSIHDGFSEIVVKNENCYSQEIQTNQDWKLCDIIAIVDSSKKKTSSLEGHKLAKSSPYFQARLKELPQRIKKVKQAIKEKNFTKLGQLIEEETISMHIITMSSKPAIFYWNSATMKIIESIKQWRTKGLESYFTIDAGSNVHIICKEKDKLKLNKKLKTLKEVKSTITNKTGKGTRLTKKHLF